MSLEDDIWWTRKARINAEKRLLANAAHVKAISLWYAFTSVAVSIFYLQSDDLDPYADALWVIYASLILAISAYNSGSNLRERAGLIKECYENLKTLTHKAKVAGSMDEVAKQYHELLGLCENHHDIDYEKALVNEHLSNPSKANSETKLKKGMTKAPTLVHYINVTIYSLKRYTVLVFLYLLPVLVLYFGRAIGA